MFTISDYLNQLDEDKDTLYNGLLANDVEATQSETFTTLTPKVENITNNIKTLIKPSINLTGANITNEPISEYPEKIQTALLNILTNGTDVIFNNWPQVSQEGYSIVQLNETIEAPMKIQIKGNLTQATTPAFDTPVEVKVVKGNNHIRVYYGEDEQLYYIYLPEGTELCAIGNYSDYIFENNNEWYIHKAIEKITFNGDPEVAWSMANWSGNKLVYLSIPNLKKMSTTDFMAYSNHFYKDATALDRYSATPGMFCAYNNSTNVAFVIPSTYSSIQLWNAYLSTNNVILYYVANEPTDIKITDTTLINQLNLLKNAHSYYPNTYLNILNDDTPKNDNMIILATALKEVE